MVLEKEFYWKGNKFYTIGEDGLVRRYNSKMECNVVKFDNDFRGYSFVTIINEGVKEKFYLHFLVASNFIPNPNQYKIIRHKDGDLEDNRVENLEWVESLVEQ